MGLPNGKKRRVDPYFADRLKLFLDTLHSTNRQVALSIGITSSALSAILARKSCLAQENLLKLHELYGLNINWLLSGQGPMVIDRENGGRALPFIAWDADQVPDDAALSDEVSARLREKMWHSETDLDPDQYIVLRFLLERMAVGLGRPPSSLFIRKMLFVAQGPNPRDSRIPGRLTVAEEPPK